MTQVSLGRVVHYTLSDTDVAAINDQFPESTTGQWRRNSVHAGDVCKADVVYVFAPASNAANLQVALDGNVTYWATSRVEGDPGQPGTWAWPLRG